MADIRENGWEWYHYDNPDFQVQLRKNYIPAGIKIQDIKSIHWHDDLEFIYVLQGTTHYEMADKVVKMTAGEGIFVNSKQLHLIHPDKDEDCLLICLIFHPIILCSTEHITNTYVKPLIENKNIQYVHLKESNEWQKRVLHDIADMEAYLEDENGYLKTMSLIFDIWEQLFKNLVTNESDEEVSFDLTCMKRMIQYIHKNYMNKISLQKICEAGNVGRSKCNALFEKYYNVSPIEYVKNFRIEQGAKLLTMSDMSVTEIAYETGFTDGSYFSKAFSNKIGISPLKYRAIGKGMSRYYELPESQNI